MFIAKVIGNVTATQKHSAYKGRKLLQVQPVDLSGEPMGRDYLAIDLVDAGIGDTVILTIEGSSAMSALGDPHAPANAIIIAVVDEIDIYGNNE